MGRLVQGTFTGKPVENDDLGADLALGSPWLHPGCMELT